MREAFFRYRHAQVLGFGAVAARALPPQRHKPLPEWLFYAIVFVFLPPKHALVKRQQCFQRFRKRGNGGRRAKAKGSGF